MTVKEIVTKYLKENGFDGLCDGGCGCALDDLMPCETLNDNCNAGYKRKITKKDDTDWFDIEVGDTIICTKKG